MTVRAIPCKVERDIGEGSTSDKPDMRRTPRPWTQILLALLALIVPPLLAAEDSDYAFDPLRDHQILSQSSIHAFAQDPMGFLWIGTQYGLDRFDGFQMRRYAHDPANPDSLSSDFVLDLLLDRDGMLWVGTTRGLDRLDPLSGRIVRHRFDTTVADPDETSAGITPQSLDPAIEPDSLVELPNGSIMALFEGRPARVAGPGRLEYVEIDHYGDDYSDESNPDPARPTPSLALDVSGRPWLASAFGLWRLDAERDRFVRLLQRSPGPGPRHGGPHRIAPGPGRTIAYAHSDGVTLIDIDRGHALRHLRPSEFGADSDHVDAVAIDSGNRLWLVTPNQLLRVPANLSGPWQSFEAESLHGANSQQRMATLFLEETPTGQIWLAGRFGVVSYDPEDLGLIHYRHVPANPRSLPPTLGEVGYRIFIDRFDVLWIGGTLGGITRRPPQRNRFVHIHETAPSSISRNIVRGIAEQQIDDEEFVWVANQNHGIVVWKRTGQRSYMIEHHYPAEASDRVRDRVRQLVTDPTDGSIWIVGQHGLRRARRPGAALLDVDVGPDSVSQSVRWLEFLTDDRVAIGLTGEVRVLARSDPDPDQLGETLLSANLGDDFELFSMAQLDHRRLIAVGFGGVRIIDLEGGDVQALLPGGPDPTAPDNQLFSVAVDAQRRVWLGSRTQGLLEIDPDADPRQHSGLVGKPEGLTDHTVYAILVDDSDSLWLSGNQGITRFRPGDGMLRHYGPGDGLQAWEFSNTVGNIGGSGRFYFGGVNGWNAFRPGTVRDLLRPPSVQLQSVRQNGRTVQDFGPERSITLKHDATQLAIDYVGLHFAAPDQIRFAWRLRGLNEHWTDAGTTRQARWASLPAGRYDFELRAANLDGIWSPPRRLLAIQVQAAPWNTVWARLAYLVAAVAVLLALLRYQRSRQQRMQQLIDRRTQELADRNDLIEIQASQLRDSLEARTLMFANVSHEFRTPLTLIRASIDKLELAPDPATAEMGRRYINRLLRLVEQLLDLSRLRLTEAGARESAWRLDSMVSQTVDAFRPVAEHHSQRLVCDTGGAWHSDCSREAVERILLNLIANAIKFTPDGGSITVSMLPDPAGVVLEVADSGPGIEQQQQPLIFHRFYRAASNQATHSGSGIGLALVHEAVRTIGGRIELDSAPGEGARFRVRMAARRPNRETPLRPAPIDIKRRQLDLDALMDDPVVPDASPSSTPPAAAGRRTPRILVVEDNPDLRQHLAKSLGQRWGIATANDGEQGYRDAARRLPDLIVSDLMMPNVDGFEMLQRLREDIATSHIPVLFLTARQDHETRLRAFSLSADGFLSKPFDERELEARIEQMLQQRRRLHRFLRHSRLDQSVTGSNDQAGTAGSASLADAVSPRDQEFLQRLDAWLEQHYSSPSSDVERMADALHMTARTLQRKLKGLTGQTPAERLRDFRLEKARSRLASEDCTVTEIGLECGFASAQYFSRVFRRQFGIAPNQWRRRSRSE